MTVKIIGLIGKQNYTVTTVLLSSRGSLLYNLAYTVRWQRSHARIKQAVKKCILSIEKSSHILPNKGAIVFLDLL